MTPREAELYALTHRGTPGDVEFYARACAGARRVLELGTGYGRLLPALAEKAAEVTGLDREAVLLRLARRRLARLPAHARRAVRLVQADMQSFELPGCFDRILLPYNALYCLLTRQALRSCFRNVRRHLAPEGKLLFDVWSADAFQPSREPRAYRDDTDPILCFEHRGVLWDVFEHSRLRSREQRLDVTYTYVPRSRGPSLDTHIFQRYSTSRQLALQLGAAGLELERLWGSFDRRRFGQRSPQLIAQVRALPG